jgi:hypothetical protein
MKKAKSPPNVRTRALYEQRVVVDELEAQLTLCEPEDEDRLKARIDVERATLVKLDSMCGPKRNAKPQN